MLIIKINDNTPFPSLFTLMPTIGAGLILLFAKSQTMAGRVLSIKPLVLIGLISYSAYLWHQPIFAFVRHMSFPEPSLSAFFILTILILPLSYLSWRFIEQPFRKRNIVSRKTVFIFSITGSLVFIIIGEMGTINKGFRERSMYKSLLVKNYQPDNRLLQTQSWSALKKLSENKEYYVVNNEYDNKLWFSNKDARRRLLLIGNSHSKDMFNLLMNSDVATANFQIARYGTQISKLVEEDVGLFYSPNYDQSDIIVIVSRYSEKDLNTIGDVVERILRDGKRLVIVKSIFEFDCYNGKTLADHLLRKSFINELNSHDASTASIVEKINRAHYAQYTSRGRLPQNQESDVALESLSDKYREIILLDRMNYVCEIENTICFSINEKLEKYFYDSSHHTSQGAEFFGHRIDQTGWLNALVNDVSKSP